MNKTNAKKSKTTKIKRTENYYQQVKKVNTISIMICGVFLVIGLLFFTIGLPKWNARKADQNVEYHEMIAYYEAEKEAIENGEKATDQPSFEETIESQEEYYEEFDSSKDTYEIDIDDVGTIQINRNNIFVSDNAHILSDDVKEQVWELNRQMNDTANGTQLMVVTIPELPDGESIESYATAIFNTLGIGNSEEDNGVLYLMSIDEQETRLEVGYGLESSLTDATSQDILDDEDVIDAYQDEDYSTGVEYTLALIEPYINTKTPQQDAAIADYEGKLALLPFLYAIPVVIIVLLTLFFVWYLSSILKSRRLFEKDHQKLVAIEEKEDDPQAANRAIEQLDLYKLAVYGTVIWQSYRHILRARDLGKILQRHPNGKRVGGNVLVGEVLYNRNGRVLTHTYSESSYSGHSDSSSGGGFGGGSFGGGSSGGGGASGGW